MRSARGAAGWRRGWHDCCDRGRSRRGLHDVGTERRRLVCRVERIEGHEDAAAAVDATLSPDRTRCPWDLAEREGLAHRVGTAGQRDATESGVARECAGEEHVIAGTDRDAVQLDAVERAVLPDQLAAGVELGDEVAGDPPGS